MFLLNFVAMHSTFVMIFSIWTKAVNKVTERQADVAIHRVVLLAWLN